MPPLGANLWKVRAAAFPDGSHLALGKLYRAAGEWKEARESLATAITLFREMDMRYWLGQAEAEMRTFP